MADGEQLHDGSAEGSKQAEEVLKAFEEAQEEKPVEEPAGFEDGDKDPVDVLDVRNPVRPEAGTTLDRLAGLPISTKSDRANLKDFPYREIQTDGSQEATVAAARQLTNLLDNVGMNIPDINQQALAREQLDKAWKTTGKSAKRGLRALFPNQEDDSKFTREGNYNSLRARVLEVGTAERPQQVVIYGESNVAGKSPIRERQNPVDTATRGVITIPGSDGQDIYWETSSVDDVTKLYRVDKDGTTVPASDKDAEWVQQLLGLGSEA